MIYTTRLYALNCDGVNFAYLPDDDTLDMGTSDFAVDALVYAEDGGILAMKAPSNLAGQKGWVLAITETYERVEFVINDGDASPVTVATRNGSFALNKWHWVRVEADRDGYARIYIDGCLAGQGEISAAAGDISNSNYLIVWAITGKIGLLRLHKGTIKGPEWVAAEWRRLQTGGEIGSAFDATAVWWFDDQNLIDRVGGRALTYTGTPAWAYVAITTPPSPYYEAEEARLTGARPRLLLSIHPRNFPTGLPEGAGTYTNCVLIEPERLQVITGTPASATWESTDIEAQAADYPITVETTWVANLVDYSLEVELKTAASQAGLSGASYQEASNGGTFPLLKWFKIKVTFTRLGSPTPDAYIEDLLFYNNGYPSETLTTGLETCSGTFTNSSCASGRVTVNHLAGTASWLGPVGYNSYGASKNSKRISWAEEPGSHRLRMYVRSAQYDWKINEAPWTEVSNGGTITVPAYYSYQIKAEWQLAVFGSDTWLDRLRLGAEIAIDPDDVSLEDTGLPRLEAPVDFSDLVAGDFTAVLLDPDGRYDPNSSNFLLADEELWFGKSLRVRFGFQRPGTDIIDSWLLFEGVILRWGPRETAAGEGAIPKVEIYAQDTIAQLFNLPISPTDENGERQPVVYGDSLLLEAAEQANDNFNTPSATAGFETGDTSELTGVDTSGNGTVTVVSSDAYTGTYCLQTKVYPAGANAQAVAKLSVGGNSAQFQAKAAMKVLSMPTAPSVTGARIMGGLKADGTVVWELYVDEDSRLYAKKGSTTWPTDQLLRGLLGRWVEVGWGWLDSTNDLFVVWIDGNEVLRVDDASLANSIDRLWVGVKTGTTAEAWTILWDDLKVWNSFYPNVQFVKGAPYQEITTVYVDGVSTVAPIRKRSRRQQRLDKKWNKKYLKGKRAAKTLYTAKPEWGAIIWSAWYDRPPEGQVMLLVKKNDITHPVDIIQNMLISWGLEAYIDTASFNAAKAVTSGLAMSCYFDDGSRGDAISAICAAALLSLYREGQRLKIQAYTGSALGDAMMVLGPVNRKSTRSTNDQSELIPKVRGIWGWHERNKRLQYEVTDEALALVLGDDEDEIDLSYGNSVVCADAETVKALVNALALRLQRPREEVEVEAYLEAARMELFDVVSLDGRKYQVFAKEIDFQSQSVRLRLIRFLGLEE